MEFDFKANRDFNGSDLYADVNPVDKELLELIDKISSIRVRQPQVTGLRSLRRARKLQYRMTRQTHNHSFRGQIEPLNITSLWDA